MVKWWSRSLWGAHLLALLAVAAATGLGVWQWNAWQDHRAAEARDLTHATPVPLDRVLTHDARFPGDGVGRPVEVSGTWLTDGTVLVDGRTDDHGRRGLWVVTPLTNGDAAAAAIPVVRGWVPQGTVPSAVPPPPKGTARITGWLQPPEDSGAPDTDPHDAVLPEVQIAAVAQRVKQDLYGGFVIDEHPDSGLEPATLSQLPSVGAGTGLRNFLYAFEWWFFGAFAAWIWWKHVREATMAEPPEDAADEAPDEHRVASES